MNSLSEIISLVNKQLDSARIPETGRLPIMVEAGNLREIRNSGDQAQYFDRLNKAIRTYLISHIDPAIQKEALDLVNNYKPKPKRIDTGVFPMPTAKPKPEWFNDGLDAVKFNNELKTVFVEAGYDGNQFRDYLLSIFGGVGLQTYAKNGHGDKEEIRKMVTDNLANWKPKVDSEEEPKVPPKVTFGPKKAPNGATAAADAQAAFDAPADDEPEGEPTKAESEPEPEKAIDSAAGLKEYKRKVVEAFKAWKPDLPSDQIAPLHFQATSFSSEVAYETMGDDALLLVQQFIEGEINKAKEITLPETKPQEPPTSIALTIPSKETETSAAITSTTVAMVSIQPQSWLKLPTPAEQNYIIFCAEMAAMAGIYKNKGMAAICLLRGFGLGVSPDVAVSEIWEINGKPYPSSLVLRAVVKKHSDCIRFDVVASEDGKKAVAYVQRKGQDARELTYSWADAEKAKLTSKDVWLKNPKPMLTARVTRNAVMAVWPELALGLGISDVDEE